MGKRVSIIVEGRKNALLWSRIEAPSSRNHKLITLILFDNLIGIKQIII